LFAFEYGVLLAGPQARAKGHQTLGRQDNGVGIDHARSADCRSRKTATVKGAEDA
jgi:hypothetical protein